MARRNYGTSDSRVLTFYRGDSNPITVECHPADIDDDVMLDIKRSNEHHSYFLRREQARRFARLLLDAAAE